MSPSQESSPRSSDDKHALANSPAHSVDEHNVEGAGLAEPFKPSFYRGTIFQAAIVGLCSFLSPGIWNAMNATGAGGAQEPYLVNAANALVFGLMVFFCSIGSVVSNKIGMKWALVIGTMGYAPYAAGLYTNKVFGTEWFVLFGAALCGISAGIFWSVEGAIILGYPEASKRGMYLAVWLAFKSGGQVLGGVINTALNVKSGKAGSISSNTYLVFIALQCTAPFVALLLSEPHKVQREDRTPVLVGTSKFGWKKELTEVWKVFGRKEVLCLAPIAFYSSIMGPWTGTYLALYFSVRARAVASLVTAILGIVANFLLGWFLDSKKISLKTRARWSYLLLAAMGLASWIWSLVIQIEFSAHKPKTLDWATHGGSFSRAYCLYILYALNTSTLQNLLYFVIGGISVDAEDIGRLSSILRALESAGSAVGYGITSNKTMSHLIPLGIDIGFFGISFPIGWFCVKTIGVTRAGGYKADEAKMNIVPGEEHQAVEKIAAAEGKSHGLGPQA